MGGYTLPFRTWFHHMCHAGQSDACGELREASLAPVLPLLLPVLLTLATVGSCLHSAAVAELWPGAGRDLGWEEPRGGGHALTPHKQSCAWKQQRFSPAVPGLLLPLGAGVIPTVGALVPWGPHRSMSLATLLVLGSMFMLSWPCSCQARVCQQQQ